MKRRKCRSFNETYQARKGRQVEFVIFFTSVVLHTLLSVSKREQATEMRTRPVNTQSEIQISRYLQATNIRAWKTRNIRYIAVNQ
jgi:hypothetical protein